ncbi:MAG TPA: hypothetical protein VFX34_00400, partial [Sporosarcina sp.]|nr:hypothetical protein [Sporosarcina sp.]
MKSNRFMKWVIIGVVALMAGIGNLFGTGKMASAEQTVLVEEDFDQLEGAMPEGWNVIQGQASVEDGALKLTSPSSASPSRVLVPLPEKNGNIVFEADMTFVSAVEDTRWASMMFRVQSGDYPYYQFAIRRGTNALNGAEFAERNAQNKWVVPEATFFTEKFEFNKPYRIKIIASNNRVQQFINNKLVIN